MQELKKIAEERHSTPETREGDLFNRVIAELQKYRIMLTEEIALNLTFVLLFARFEATFLTLTLAINYLTDHPQVLDKLTICSLCLSVPFLLLYSYIKMRRWLYM